MWHKANFWFLFDNSTFKHSDLLMLHGWAKENVQVILTIHIQSNMLGLMVCYVCNISVRKVQ